MQNCQHSIQLMNSDLCSMFCRLWPCQQEPWHAFKCNLSCLSIKDPLESLYCSHNVLWNCSGASNWGQRSELAFFIIANCYRLTCQITFELRTRTACPADLSTADLPSVFQLQSIRRSNEACVNTTANLVLFLFLHSYMIYQCNVFGSPAVKLVLLHVIQRAAQGPLGQQQHGLRYCRCKDSAMA